MSCIHKQRIVVASLMLFAMALIVPAAHSQGFDIEYLDSWPMTNQMRYVKVRITPVGGKSPRDVDFHVVSKSNSYNRTAVSVSTVIPMRIGDTSATGELYIPNIGHNHSMHTEIDGNLTYDRRDFALQNYYLDFYSNQQDSSTGSAPSFVIASSDVDVDSSVKYTGLSRSVPGNMAQYGLLSTTKDFPSLDDLTNWYVTTNSAFNGNRMSPTINGISSPVISAMSLESLPSKWFAYTGLGMLMITFDDLKLLSQKHPGKLLAIERWVAAAGRLVVIKSGDQLASADEALQLLGDSNDDVRGNRVTKFLAEEFNSGQLQDALDAVNEARKIAGPMRYGYQRTVFSNVINQSAPPVTVSEDTFKNILANQNQNPRDIISVEFGQGQVLFVSNTASDWKNEKNSNIDRWGGLGFFLNVTDRNLADKHNVIAGTMARQFGFPEFAEPPRYVFEFSILLYLLAVGPMTFFLLKRKHKLNLMFVIVPMISTLFCTTILAYAIFSEGFDTRVNLFTFTALDQQSGRQSTSSIAHVYSGMTPSAYRFSGPDYGMVNLTGGGRTQRLNWNDAGQQISGGEIRARSNHQLFARSSNETSSRLVFSFKGSGESASATVRNDFQNAVSAVVFRSDQCSEDEAWFCEGAGVGEIAEAKKMPIEDISAAMKTITQASMSATVYASGISPGKQRNSTGLSGIEKSEVANELSKAWRMMYSDLKRHLQSSDGRGFIAITEGAINYEVPIEDATLETEIHIVKGIR